MKKLLLFILLFVAPLIFCLEEKELSKYIGAAAGFSTGYGLSYRYWPENYGTQIVFTPYTSGNDIRINLGTAILRTLYKTKNTRLFLFIAGNTTYIDKEVYIIEAKEPAVDEEYIEPDPTRVQILEGAIGIGPGLEIYIFKNIALDIMFGYRYGFAGEMEGLGFTGEVALYYRF